MSVEGWDRVHSVSWSLPFSFCQFFEEGNFGTHIKCVLGWMVLRRVNRLHSWKDEIINNTISYTIGLIEIGERQKLVKLSHAVLR